MKFAVIPSVFILTIFSITAPAQALNRGAPVVLCKTDGRIKMEFFAGPPASMLMDKYAGYPPQDYSITPGDVDIVAFFRERSTQTLNGSFQDDNRVSYPITISHEEGVPTVRWASSGYGFSIKCTLPDGTPVAPPLPLPKLPVLKFPVCGRTQAVKDELEHQTKTSCESIDMRKLSTVKRLDLSNRGITALKNGDFEGIGYPREGSYSSDFEISHINLSHNLLESLPEGLFGSAILATGGGTKEMRAVHLNQFDLSHNRLKAEPDFKKSGKFIYPIDSEIFGERAEKFWDLSYNQITSVNLSYALCGQLRLSHNQISELPEEIRLLETCVPESVAPNRIQSIDLSDNLITDTTLDRVKAIRVETANYRTSLLLNNNPITKFDLGKIQAYDTYGGYGLGQLSFGGNAKFDLSSLKHSNWFQIENLEISNCLGTPGVDFTRVEERLILKDCDISLPNGFGQQSKLSYLRLENGFVKDINVNLLMGALNFQKPFSADPSAWWLGVLEFAGRNQISANDLESIRKEYVLREQKVDFAWDCDKPQGWWSGGGYPPGQPKKICQFLRIGPDMHFQILKRPANQ